MTKEKEFKESELTLKEHNNFAETLASIRKFFSSKMKEIKYKTRIPRTYIKCFEMCSELNSVLDDEFFTQYPNSSISASPYYGKYYGKDKKKGDH